MACRIVAGHVGVGLDGLKASIVVRAGWRLPYGAAGKPPMATAAAAGGAGAGIAAARRVEGRPLVGRVGRQAQCVLPRAGAAPLGYLQGVVPLVLRVPALAPILRGRRLHLLVPFLKLLRKHVNAVVVLDRVDAVQVKVALYVPVDVVEGSWGHKLYQGHEEADHAHAEVGELHDHLGHARLQFEPIAHHLSPHEDDPGALP
mmetsp:Transcript_78277/g.221348  ORF Transcript_78277/g.221348 Transcript_78277/m.221348 type:complete len:202 (+) Transcript_78277:1559-2164(+)